MDQGMTKEELDERNVKTRQLAGSSVEIVTDSGAEREQSVAVRSVPTMHESPEQFRERIEKEED